MTTTRQRNDDEAELHSTGTLMWTRSRHGKHSDPTRLSWKLAWHARSVHWMYLQAQNKHKHNDRQYHDIYLDYHQCKIILGMQWSCSWDKCPSGLTYQPWPFSDHKTNHHRGLNQSNLWSLWRSPPHHHRGLNQSNLWSFRRSPPRPILGLE